jgi:gluconokinase
VICAAGLHVIVMGVSGSGKTTVGQALASSLGFEFIEADAFHPAANIERMTAGIPLTDEDREPWLAALVDVVRERHDRGIGTVLACSALRRAYRDRLRTAVPQEESFVVALETDDRTLRTRLQTRRGHYMPASLLASQLATLELLEPDERGVRLDAGLTLQDVVSSAEAAARDRSSRR